MTLDEVAEHGADDRVLWDVVQTLLFGLGDEVADGLGLRGGWVDAAARQAGEQEMEVVAELQRAEAGDPDRATQLLGGVDDPGGLAAVSVGDRVHPHRVVDGEHDP